MQLSHHLSPRISRCLQALRNLPTSSSRHLSQRSMAHLPKGHLASLQPHKASTFVSPGWDEGEFRLSQQSLFLLSSHLSSHPAPLHSCSQQSGKMQLSSSEARMHPSFRDASCLSHSCLLYLLSCDTLFSWSSRCRGAVVGGRHIGGEPCCSSPPAGSGAAQRVETSEERSSMQREKKIKNSAKRQQWVVLFLWEEQNRGR